MARLTEFHRQQVVSVTSRGVCHSAARTISNKSRWGEADSGEAGHAVGRRTEQRGEMEVVASVFSNSVRHYARVQGRRRVGQVKGRATRGRSRPCGPIRSGATR
jgi:hypothetical protein